MNNINFLRFMSIFATVLLIAMIVVVVRYHNWTNKLTAELNAAKSQASEAEQKAKAAAQDVVNLKQAIDVAFGDVDVQKVLDEHKRDMTKYSPSVNEVRSYRVALTTLFNELDAGKKEHEQEKASRLQLEADYKNLQALYQSVTDKYRQEQEKAIADLNKSRQEFTATLSTTGEQMKNVNDQKIAVQEKAEIDVRIAREEAAREKKRAEDAEERCGELGSKLQQLLRPIFDRPDGVIEVVDLSTRVVIVDLGYADGVETRMTFSVYDPKIAGISYDSSLYGDTPTLCESCKRNVNLHASKASIEIIKIIGPHRSEARIIIDKIVNPILAGDVIHSPIWDRGQKLHVALCAGMFLPDVGNPANDPSLGSLEDIINLIKLNGGVVDCYISNGEIDENVKRGQVVGLENISSDTSFVVVGSVKEDGQENDVMAAQVEIRKKAKALAVKEISLKELLLKLGWRNPTPLRDYGTGADEFDMKIKPEGGRRLSNANVSQYYDKPNYNAGVSINDHPKALSNGAGVSSIYSNKTSKPISTGTASGLFRSRKPSTTNK
ncbi:MAG: hypothetical protein LBQ66_05525 [Planctomycetaceae bacterium]|jgi:hypothetical protein|nr:hypothetical protein [Planctomycetaceae bacterium]